MKKRNPNFIALHELFDKVNEDIEDYEAHLQTRR